MPVSPTARVAYYRQLGDGGIAFPYPPYVFGTLDNPPGAPYTHFCPTRFENGDFNDDPNNGAWFDINFPATAGIDLYSEDPDPIGVLMPNDPRVAWDAPWEDYYAAWYPGQPEDECLGLVGGTYPYAESVAGDTAILFLNDSGCTYPPPELRGPGAPSPGFGVFFCLDAYSGSLVGGGALSQTPTLLYRTLAFEEGGFAHPDPDYWWSCYYCPEGYTYNPDSGLCEEDGGHECPEGQCWSEPDGACVDCTPPECADELNCVWSEADGTFHCDEPSCPDGQVWSGFPICGCVEIDTSRPPLHKTLSLGVELLREQYQVVSEDESGVRWLSAPYGRQAVTIPAGSHAVLAPEAGSVGVILRLNSARNLSMRQGADGTLIPLTDDQGGLGFPVVLPRGDDNTFRVYSTHTADQTIEMLWL